MLSTDFRSYLSTVVFEKKPMILESKKISDTTDLQGAALNN